jgi:hypothetical protein
MPVSAVQSLARDLEELPLASPQVHSPAEDWDCVQTRVSTPVGAAGNAYENIPALAGAALDAAAPVLQAPVVRALGHGLQAGRRRAVPAIRQAGDLGSRVGRQVLQQASGALEHGVPAACEAAVALQDYSQNLSAAVHEELRWLTFSGQRRQQAEALQNWLVAKGYLLVGVVQRVPTLASLRDDHLRREPIFGRLTIRQLENICAALPWRGSRLHASDLARALCAP